jgi:serine/threonine protein kinase
MPDAPPAQPPTPPDGPDNDADNSADDDSERRGNITGKEIYAFLVGYVIGEGGMGYVYSAIPDDAKFADDVKGGVYKRQDVHSFLMDRIVAGLRSNNFYKIPSLEQKLSEDVVSLRKQIAPFREMDDEARAKATRKAKLNPAFVDAQLYQMGQEEAVRSLVELVSEVQAVPHETRAEYIHKQRIEERLALKMGELSEDTVLGLMLKSPSIQKAEQVQSTGEGTRVALKTFKVRTELDRNVADHPERRFEREAKLTFRHSVPGVITPYAHIEKVRVTMLDGSEHDIGVIALRYIDTPWYKEGPINRILSLENIETFDRQHVNITYKASLDMLIEALDIARKFHKRESDNGKHALYAGREGMIHRDLKPANIMLEEDPFGPIEIEYIRPDGSHGGRVRISITDLGLAMGANSAVSSGGQLTETGGFAGGSPYYIAPNQIPGFEQTISTDVVALGRTFFNVLTYGKHPFEVEDEYSGNPGDRIMWQLSSPTFDAPFALEFDSDIPVELSDFAALLGNMHYGQETALPFEEDEQGRVHDKQFWSRLYDRFDPKRWRFREGPDSEFAYKFAKRLSKRDTYTSPDVAARNRKTKRKIEKLEARIDKLKKRISHVKAEGSLQPRQREERLYELERKLAVSHVAMAYAIPASTREVNYPYAPAKRDKRLYTRSYNLGRALIHYERAVESRLSHQVERIYKTLCDNFTEDYVVNKIVPALRANTKSSQTHEPDEGEMVYLSIAEKAAAAAKKLTSLGSLNLGCSVDDETATKLSSALEVFVNPPQMGEFGMVKETLEASLGQLREFFGKQSEADRQKVKPYLDALEGITNPEHRVSYAAKAQAVRLLEVYLNQHPHWKRTADLRELFAVASDDIFYPKIIRMIRDYVKETHARERTQILWLLDFELYKDEIFGMRQSAPSTSTVNVSQNAIVSSTLPVSGKRRTSSSLRGLKKGEGGTEVALDVPDPVKVLVPDLLREIGGTIGLAELKTEKLCRGAEILDGGVADKIGELRTIVDVYLSAALPKVYENVVPATYQKLLVRQQELAKKGQVLHNINTLCQARVAFEQLAPLNQQRATLEEKLGAPEQAEAEFKTAQDGFVESLAKLSASVSHLPDTEKAQTVRPLKTLEVYATSRDDVANASNALAALSYIVGGLVEQYPSLETARAAHEALQKIKPTSISKSKDALKDAAIYAAVDALPDAVKGKIGKDAARLKSYGAGKGKADTARKALAAVSEGLGEYVRAAAVVYDVKKELDSSTGLAKRTVELAGKPAELKKAAEGAEGQIKSLDSRLRDKMESIGSLCKGVGAAIPPEKISIGTIMGAAAQLYEQIGYKARADEIREAYSD